MTSEWVGRRIGYENNVHDSYKVQAYIANRLGAAR